MITCTNTQGFEEGENYASTISVEHTLGSDMNFIGSDMILFGSDMILIGYKIQELSVPLVAVLINFGVKKQVPKISFKGFEEGENCASTSSVEHTPGSDMEFIGSDIILFLYYIIFLGSRVQEISLLLVAVLINFGVKKQVPKISFKSFLGDLILFFSHEFSDIIFYKYLYIL